MLRTLKTYRIGVGTISFIVIFLVFLIIGSLTPTYENCQAKYATVSTQVWRFFACELETAEANNGLVTAFATTAIAAFTLTLWLVAGDQLRHGREIERAYVSGGGSREISQEIHQNIPANLPVGSITYPQADGTILVLRPTGRFRIDANNHGKTRALVHQIQHGFCDAACPLPSRSLMAH